MLLAACSEPRYYPQIDDRSTPAQDNQRLPSSAGVPVKQPRTATLDITPVDEMHTGQQVTKVNPQAIDSGALTAFKPAIDASLQELGQPVTSLNRTQATANDQQAVNQMLQQADLLQDQPKAAILLVQRAMRIAPRDPRIYARLAVLQFDQGQLQSAEQVARKGLSMAAGQADYQYFFFKLIAACRRLQGDQIGEEQAIQQAQQYQLQ
jgi:tetratricopeptide (TPR) repeat protein